MKIFLSYSWNNTNEANSIESFFSSIGVSIIRDINDIEFKDNLRAFMSLIRETDFAIILVSDKYMKSPNCIYELIELSKEKEFNKKIIPILVDETKIYSIESKLKIINYWKEKVSSTKELLANQEATKIISLIEELKLYETIYSEIDSFLITISKCKNIEFTEGISNNFKDIINYIGLESPEIKVEISRIQKIEDRQIQDLELEKLKQKYPGNAEVLFSEAFINGKRKNYKKSEHFYLLCLEKEKNNFWAYNNLGTLYGKTEQYEKAEINFKKALELNTTSYELFFNIGLFEYHRGNFEKAIENFKKSIELNSQNYYSLYSLGKIYSDSLNEIDKGLEYYEEANKIDPRQQETYTNIASNYIRKNDFDTAIIYLEKGLKINPDDYIIMYNLAAVYANVKGMNSEAKILYRKAIRENPLYTSPKIGLAKLLIKTGGDVGEAVELMKDILKIEPENEDVKFILSYFDR